MLNFNPFLTPFIGVLAFISVIITYYLIAIVVNNPSATNFRFVEWVLFLDLVLFLLLTLLISHRVIQFGQLKKSKLQSKIVFMFSVVGIIPTIVVSVFSTVFLNYGVKAWFDTRIETALAESVKVAHAYLNEHVRNLIADTRAMEYDLSSSMDETMLNTPKIIENVLHTQANLRGLFEFVLFKPDKILIKSRPDMISEDDIKTLEYQKADNDQVLLSTNNNEGKVSALVKLKNFQDTYLLVGKLIDHKVLHHMETTQGADYAYRDLKNNISIIQLQFFIAFILVSLLLLLASIWAGIVLSDNVVKPVSNLVHATNRIRTGDLGVEVVLSGGQDEISDLEEAFNHMTLKLQEQRKQLVEANDAINERRIFVETVISNLSSGVIVVNLEEKVSLINNYAKECLKLSSDVTGVSATNLLPELPEIIALQEQHNKFSRGQEISLIRDSSTVNLLLSIVHFHGGYIITFDNITKLVNAQKAYAWADIARKIAHEIKNPITPICLASHRLKRLYKEIQIASSSKTDLIYKYIDTIERNSANLSRIVDEFANFARMPTPIMNKFEVSKLLNAVVFSRQVSDNNMEYKLILPSETVFFIGDEGQIELALYNILKNSSQAISENTKSQSGSVTIELYKNHSDITIIIHDNGPGFDENVIKRLLEPYMTTRAKGNGLGLAIVKKIINEHNGEINLANIYDKNNHCKGAKVTVKFPIK